MNFFCLTCAFLVLISKLQKSTMPVAVGRRGVCVCVPRLVCPYVLTVLYCVVPLA